jgi:hypothetical protein
MQDVSRSVKVLGADPGSGHNTSKWSYVIGIVILVAFLMVALCGNGGGVRASSRPFYVASQSRAETGSQRTDHPDQYGFSGA